MSPSHTKKSNGRRYRYYVSQALLQNDRARAGTVSRVPAEAIVRLVDTEIRRLWSASEGGASRPAEVNLLPRDFVERLILCKDKVEIVMSEEGLKKLVPHDSPAISDTRSHPPKKFSVSVQLARRSRSGQLERSDGKVDHKVGRPDAAVVKAISRAYDWLGRFERGEVASYHELARAEGFTPGYVRSVMQLAFLAPPLVEAFLDGRRRLRGGVVELLNDSLRSAGSSSTHWCEVLSGRCDARSGYRHYHPDTQRKFSEFAPSRPIHGSVCALVLSVEA
jgi:hypothetical protein